MRGTRVHTSPRFVRGWIIPAHAGNSPRHPPDCPQLSDHPRACGELKVDGRAAASHYGSSPRMRGTRDLPQGAEVGMRIIPAHAGNSPDCTTTARAVPDHPRACGELQWSNSTEDIRGGSSPRMRGTLLFVKLGIVVARIIPAHAGNSTPTSSLAWEKADHPRACGERSRRPRSDATVSGR